MIQSDEFNRSKLATVLCVPLTSNLRWADAPGNVLLLSSETGLPRDSVALVAACVAVDRQFLTEQAGGLSERALMQVLNGLDIVVGRA